MIYNMYIAWANIDHKVIYNVVRAINHLYCTRILNKTCNIDVGSTVLWKTITANFTIEEIILNRSPLNLQATLLVPI